MRKTSENLNFFSSPINLSIPIEQSEEERKRFEEITTKLRSKKALINVGGHVHSVRACQTILPLWFNTDWRQFFFGNTKWLFLMRKFHSGHWALLQSVLTYSFLVDKLDLIVLWETIEKIPYSRLAKVRQVKSLPDLYAMCDDFDPETGELFFDKHPLVFVSILNFYRISKLHMPEDICPIGFQVRVFIVCIN